MICWVENVSQWFFFHVVYQGLSHLLNIFHITLHCILLVVTLLHPVFPVFVSLPSSAVSCIPLPPATAPFQCLCCKQSFLPPFILVKSFQIYYVLTKPSVGPWLECHSRFVVAYCLFFFFQIDIFICTWHLYYSGTTVRSVHRAERQTNNKLFFCKSVADSCWHVQAFSLIHCGDEPSFWVMGVFVGVGVI